MIARSRERGSHTGRSRGYGLPFHGSGSGTQTPVRPEDGIPGVPADPGPGPGSDPNPAGDPNPGGDSSSAASRHRKAPERKSWLSGKRRLALALVLAAGALGAGFSTGFGTEASAEPTVQAFLLDWQQGAYAQAAALTDGDIRKVAAELANAYTNLDATNTFLSMRSVRQQGSTAVAKYAATVDLAQAGEQWTYTSRFRLTATGGRWVIHWSRAVINPSLGRKERLAVVTTFPPRAQVEDMNGRALVTKSADYHVGVYPGRLTDMAATAARFSKVTKLNERQVLGQIQAAPPGEFLSLLTLKTGKFRKRWPALSTVPGLGYERRTDRLFDSRAREAVGAVGTEDSSELRAEGAAYQPGMTVGLTGLERAYTGELTGTPTTSVVVVNPDGHAVTTLWSSRGHAGTPVRTTLSGKDQTAADAALAARPHSGEIVAVDAHSGAIRALASRQAGSGRLPLGGTLNGRVAPGMAFSIVSAAALLSAGVKENQPLACKPLTYVGGVPFTYQSDTSATDTFASDFAAGCGTAFAQMSGTLSPGQLTKAERAFGIGASWRLGVSAFSGSASVVSGAADMAAQAIGQRGVLMSPLGMALVAAEVASGTGHAPMLVAGQSPDSWRVPMSDGELAGLRHLMRLAVSSKSAPAHAADVPGRPVYGQAGVVKTGKHAYLSWFVGYRGGLAVAAVETGTTRAQAAAALAGKFFKAAR